jgi:predicted ATPase
MPRDPAGRRYTARPEFGAQWPLRAHHTQITLNRLSPVDTRSMVADVAAQKALAERTIATVVERSGGVPLFVEELTRAVLETADANQREREIPATLHGSLMARLDRLGPAKEVIQIGAVLGGEFSYELLHAVHSIAEPDLQHALNSLADAELIYVRGIPPEASYQFKHELIRNAAYEALLRSRRKELHRAVARALTSQFAQHAEAEPALLAYHLTGAGDSDRAAAAWQRAADHSAVRGAFVEAANHYSRAIEVLLTTPDSDTRTERQMVLLISLGSVLSPTKGLASREVESVFLRAREFGGTARAQALSRDPGSLADLPDPRQTCGGAVASRTAARDSSARRRAVIVVLGPSRGRGDVVASWDAGPEPHTSEDCG